MDNQVPVIDLVSVANNNDPAGTVAEEDLDPEVIVGEPIDTDTDIYGSVIYTHGYFKKVAGTDTAVCITCQQLNANGGPKRKDTFSTAGGSTAGKF